jgi:osmotically-inducible protein OsmY
MRRIFWRRTQRALDHSGNLIIIDRARPARASFIQGALRCDPSETVDAICRPCAHECQARLQPTFYGYDRSRNDDGFGMDRSYGSDYGGRSGGNRGYGGDYGWSFDRDADTRGDWDYNRRSWSGQEYGGGYGGQERSFWDRASDEVSSWFGDEEAARRRQQDQRGRGPRNYTRSGDRIREDVNDRLTDDWRVDASDIEVTVTGTEVTLAGTVSNRDQRRRAEDIAESVSGGTHVQNNLRVKQQNQSWTGQGTTAGGVGSTASAMGTTTKR